MGSSFFDGSPTKGNLPILILSGFDDKVLESARLLGEARGLAMAGIITKPMDIDGVRVLLDRL